MDSALNYSEILTKNEEYLKWLRSVRDRVEPGYIRIRHAMNDACGRLDVLDSRIRSIALSENKNYGRPAQ